MNFFLKLKFMILRKPNKAHSVGFPKCSYCPLASILGTAVVLTQIP